MRYKCSFSKGSKDKFETFYAIFNLIDRIQCKWSKVCAAGREGSAQHGWRIIHREFPYFFTLFGFYGGRERPLKKEPIR